LKSTVNKSLQENLEIQRISLIPVIGKQIKDALDSSISNITFNVIDNSIEDIAKTKNIPAINDITNYIIQQLEIDQSGNQELSALMKGIIVETLEMVKKQVEIKLWKIDELSLQKINLLKRLENGRGNINSIKAKIEIIEKQILELQNPKNN
jgi:NADPH-dependent curcumin reductase CurA